MSVERPERRYRREGICAARWVAGRDMSGEASAAGSDLRPESRHVHSGGSTVQWQFVHTPVQHGHMSHNGVVRRAGIHLRSTMGEKVLVEVSRNESNRTCSCSYFLYVFMILTMHLLKQRDRRDLHEQIIKCDRERFKS